MGEKRLWPMRYQRIRSGVGQIDKPQVITWLEQDKAVAMATYADGHSYGTAEGI